MSDLFGNHIVGFPTRRLMFYNIGSNNFTAEINGSSHYNHFPESWNSIQMYWPVETIL